MRNLTQKRLKSLLFYDPGTGKFKWLIRIGSACGGQIAGSVSPTSQGKKYRNIYIDKIKHKAHRLAWFYMTGRWPRDQLDHIDGNGGNNKWVNLRASNKFHNQHNRRKNTNNTSGYNGVHWRRDRCRWVARIIVEGRSRYIGTFRKLLDAVEARRGANIKHGFDEQHGLPRPL